MPQNTVTVELSKRTRSELLDHIVFETLLTEISALFVNVPSDELDRLIQEAQKGICECLRLDHSSLWQVSSPGQILLTHLYRAPDLPPAFEEMDGVEFFPWVASKIYNNELVVLPDTSQAPPEAARDMESWKYFQIKSTLGIPLTVGGGPLIGVLSFEATRTPRDWPPLLVSRLQLVAQVFANALDRRAAEEKLRESEARLNLAASSANAALWSLDPNTGEVWASDAVAELFGVTSASVLSLAVILGLVHPQDRLKVQDAIREAVLQDDESRIEYRIVRPDGEMRWLVSQGRRHFRPWQKSHTLMGVTLDITEAKRLELERADFAGKLLKAQEAESARISRELHDDIGQSLALLGIEVQSALRKLEGAGPAPEVLQKLQRRLNEVSHRVSTLSHQLHSSELEFLGFAVAAKKLCREVSDNGTLRVVCTIDELPTDLGEQVELCLYRVLQESLRNCLKHSHANTVTVDARSEDGTLRLTVRDDGVGFHISSIRNSAGLGLVSMSERLHLVGGTIGIHSQPGKGTTISATIRLDTNHS